MISEDLLRLLSGLLALIPLSSVIRFIPNRTARYAYSLVLALILQVNVFGSVMMYPVYLQHLLAFATIKLAGPRCGALVTWQSIFYLSCYHIYEYLYNYGGWTMNASALLMILVCKYSLLAYNLQDGANASDKQTEQQKRNRITTSISFLDFLGYVSFLPTCLLGPPLEYNDYKNFMELKAPYDKIPSVLAIVGKTIGEATFFGVFYILSEIYTPLVYMRTDEFFLHQTWYVVSYAFVSVCLARFKYYFGWKISIAAVHACGTSYSGTDFKRINTVNPYVVETSIHIRDKISHWNISVQQWLRKCIYNRSSFKSKSVNQLYVFIVSSFWHGFYFSCYVSFILWFLQLHLQGLIFKYVQGDSVIVRLYRKSGIFGFVVLSFLVQLMFSHNGACFLILDGKSCLRLLDKVHYIPQITLILLIAIFSVLPAPKNKKVAKTDQAQTPVQLKKD